MFSSWAQLFRRRKKLILYFICSKAESARGKKFTSDLTVLLIVADKNWQRKGNQSLRNSIHSFNPLSKYFIFKTQAQPSAKLRDCNIGTLRRIKFWALFIPPTPLQESSSHFFFWIYLPDTTLFLYSLETNKKALTVGINYKEEAFWSTIGWGLVQYIISTCDS